MATTDRAGKNEAAGPSVEHRRNARAIAAAEDLDTANGAKTPTGAGSAADPQHAQHAARMKRENRVTRVATWIGVTAAAVCATVLATHEPSHSDPTAESRDVIVAHSSDRHPSETATDWVTYADHVVSVTPVAEQELTPTSEELERGEGLILRRVTLRVDNVLWSRSTPAKPAPTSFEWIAHGWQFTDGNPANRTKMAGDSQPRIELGHSYVMAIQWQEQACADGDDSIPGQWRGLGSDSNIPFDGQILGQGESEGKVEPTARALAATEAENQPDEHNNSLEEQLTGQGAPDLIRELQKAEPAAPAKSKASSLQNRAGTCE
ncbi:hypothetical protein [Streptomyces sp. NPDC002187]|uniref:hypothetical protein n=1 Tax=Streptomyces sp. NPDC002187 TaxID=3364637 RepID=UPI0036BA3CFE